MFPTVLTSSLLFLLFHLLPLLTVAEGPRLRPSTWPPPPRAPYYVGDMLNVTKCYCDGINGDTKKGHYHRFDYHNFFNDQLYTIEWFCDSDATVSVNSYSKIRFPAGVHYSIPFCWNAHDSWRTEKVCRCIRSHNGDEFCFELGNKRDPHDYYYFNKQKRGLPSVGIVESPPVQCADLCRDKVRGKVVASDVEGGWEKMLPSLDVPLMPLKSSFESYTNLDDISAN